MATRTDEFRLILETYQNRVYNQAYRMLGNAEDAEETTQDIFLKVYNSIEDFRGESALSTWIFRITSNECISRLRKKQLAVTSLDKPVGDGDDGATLGDILPGEDLNPETFLESCEAKDIVRDAVNKLPPQWAMAVSLYHFDDMSYEEIAEAMDIPKATVGTFNLRGRKQLAEMLMKYFRK